jgi:group I intron endonuclease
MITYKATNTLSGKFYIGSTTNFEKRKKAHLSSRYNYPFQNALRKNPEAFEWEVIEDDSGEPVLEQALLDMWYGKECCYNLNPCASRPPVMWGGNNPMFGKKHSEESIRKNREAHTGKAHSKESREKRSRAMAGSKNPMFGKRHTKEGLQKINDWVSERDYSGENNPNYGVPCTEEKRQKIREKLVGRKYWVNAAGEKRCQVDSPGPEWQNGKKWREGVKPLQS